MLPRRVWGNRTERGLLHLGVKSEPCSELVHRGWGAVGSSDPTDPPSPVCSSPRTPYSFPLSLSCPPGPLAGPHRHSRLTLNAVFNYSRRSGQVTARRCSVGATPQSLMPLTPWMPYLSRQAPRLLPHQGYETQKHLNPPKSKTVHRGPQNPAKARSYICPQSLMSLPLLGNGGTGPAFGCLC